MKKLLLLLLFPLAVQAQIFGQDSDGQNYQGYKSGGNTILYGDNPTNPITLRENGGIIQGYDVKGNAYWGQRIGNIDFLNSGTKSITIFGADQ